MATQFFKNPQFIEGIIFLSTVFWVSAFYFSWRLLLSFSEKIVENQTQKTMANLLFTNYYLVGWPLAILVIIAGLFLNYVTGNWFKTHLLLQYGLVGFLLICYLALGNFYNRWKRNKPFSTVGLFFLGWGFFINTACLVFVTTFKETFNWIWGLTGIALTGLVVMLLIRFFSASNKTNNNLIEVKQQENTTNQED